MLQYFKIMLIFRNIIKLFLKKCFLTTLIFFPGKVIFVGVLLKFLCIPYQQ